VSCVVVCVLCTNLATLLPDVLLHVVGHEVDEVVLVVGDTAEDKAVVVRFGAIHLDRLVQPPLLGRLLLSL